MTNDFTNPTGKTLEMILVTENVCLASPTDMFTYTDRTTAARSCLDVCLSSPDLLADIAVSRMACLGSDHYPILIEVNKEPLAGTGGPPPRWNLKQVNWPLWRLEVDLEQIPLPNTATHLNDIITKSLILAAKKHIPYSSKHSKPLRKSTSWWSAECERTVAERRASRRNLERHPTMENLKIYKQKTNACKAIIKKHKTKSWEDFVQSIDVNTPTSALWKKIKCMKQNYVAQTYPIQNGNRPILSTTEKAELFLAHYTDIPVAHHPPMVTATAISNPVDAQTDINTDITIEELKRNIKTQRLTTPGMDLVHNAFLRNLSQKQLGVMLYMYNVSWNCAEVPDIWKIGAIIPIKKPLKDGSLVTSYRPIALLSCIGKLMEKIIQRRMNWYLEAKDLYQPSLSGFRTKKSTIDPLLQIEHIIRKSLSTGKVCICVYIDMKGAFDTVCHDILISKLQKLGFHGRMLEWLRAYFSNRKLCVRLGHTYSRLASFRRGVPQGAVLSPTLFNVMLCDFPQDDFVHTASYADDITICASGSYEELQIKMQPYLDKLAKWLNDNAFIVIVSKTKMQVFTRKRTRDVPLYLNNIKLLITRQQKVLGVIFDAPHLT
jgi:hypothetical protein